VPSLASATAPTLPALVWCRGTPVLDQIRCRKVAVGRAAGEPGLAQVGKGTDLPEDPPAGGRRGGSGSVALADAWPPIRSDAQRANVWAAMVGVSSLLMDVETAGA